MDVMRNIRQQPFCWQEKTVLRKLRKNPDGSKNYTGQELSKLRNLYLTLTEIESDSMGQAVEYYTNKVSTYSGLSKDWIPKGLRILQHMGIITIKETRDHGKFSGRVLYFSSSIDETSNGTTDTGETVNGYPDTIEHNNSIEHTKDKEEKKEKNISKDIYKKSRKRDKTGVDISYTLYKENEDIFEDLKVRKLFSHRLPSSEDVGDTVNITKTLYEALQYIAEMRAGNFLEKNHLESDIFVPERTDEFIHLGLERFEMMQDPIRWPMDKSKLPKSFTAFLFNKFTGKSMFLRSLEKEPEILQSYIEQKTYDEKIPENILTKYLEWFKMYSIKLNENQIFYIKKNIFEIMKEHKKIWDNVGYLNVQVNNWRSYLGGEKPDLFIKRHLEYLHSHGDPAVGKLSISSKTWKNFATWLENEYKLKLYPTDKEFTRLFNLYTKKMDKKNINETTKVSNFNPYGTFEEGV